MAPAFFFFELAISFITIYGAVFFILVFLNNKDKVFYSPVAKSLPPMTIIIPAYNEEGTISATIQSALDADYPIRQIIVVDDGSNDRTLEIARQFEKFGVLVLHQENKGKGAALNNGIRHATGDLVTTLDSDSYIARDALKKMAGFFNDNTVGAATSLVKVWNPANLLEWIQHVEYIFIVFSRRLLTFVDSVNVTPGPLSVFKRSVLLEIGGYDEKNILEDQEIALRIQAHNYRIESSTDAEVFTRVPNNLKKLVKQRARWNRGTIRNMLKHYYLINPKFGDFGVFIMPMGLISVVSLIVIMGITISKFFSNPFSLIQVGSNFSYGISATTIVSAIILIIGIVWLLIWIGGMKRESIPLQWVLLYFILYAPLTTLFWTVVFYKELKGEKIRW